MPVIDYLPPPPDDCPCTFRTCPSVIADLKLARLTPRQAVIEAGRESATSPFVLKVANATMMDPRYRRSGAATMFIRHILQGKPAGGKAHWDYPGLGLMNVIASITQEETHARDVAILREMNEAYRNIIEAIWKDFHLLTGTGRIVDNRRTITSKLIRLYAVDREMKRTMYDEKTLKIVLHCWLQVPPCDPTREDVASTIQMIFDPDGSGKGDEPPTDYMTAAFKLFKISTFVSLVNLTLKDKQLLGKPLRKEINTISLFMREGGPVYSQLIENNVHKKVVLALRRQLRHPESEGIEDVLQQGSFCIQCALKQSDDKMALFTELVADNNFVEVGVAAFMMGSKSSSSSGGGWYNLFDRIEHCMTCQNLVGCEYHATPAFTEAARASLERMAIQTLFSLEDDPQTSRAYLSLWNRLLIVLGITPGSIRERYRLDKKCCNLDCPARRSGVRHEKKHVCVECQSVWYCNSLCQKSDWTIHKAECKNLKLATEGRGV